jgi:hypothetical protein
MCVSINGAHIGTRSSHFGMDLCAFFVGQHTLSGA